jgi:hypothetical protein
MFIGTVHLVARFILASHHWAAAMKALADHVFAP